VVEGRKRAVSIRMNVADVRRIKKLAQRLNVRDSDIIRFAIKAMLARLMPFYEPEARGRNLVPVLIEAGVEFLRFFDLDTARLDAIINSEVEPEKRVSREDLALIALAGIREPYAALKLSELKEGGGDDRLLEGSDVSTSIRQYLYQKYVYRASGEADAAEESGGLRTVPRVVSIAEGEAAAPAPLRFALAGGTHE
jgi:hypothetical protein